MKNIVWTTTKYVINEREYKSLDEMPPENRKFFEDANQNRIPDGFERLLAEGTEAGGVQKMESSNQHCEVVESSVVSDGGAVLDRETIRKMLGACESQPPSESELPPLRPPPPAKHSVTFSLDLKTLVIIVLLGIVGLLVALLILKAS